jgi:tRNA threonylcarbamoyladenosine biosynthesis protein TsaB
MGAGLGVAPVCSLAALALQGGDGDVFVATDARMGEVYSAAFRVRNESVDELRAPLCTPPGELTLPADGRWIGLGSALGVYESVLPADLFARLLRADAAAVPRAADVARLAVSRVRSGRLVAAECASPLYIRDKVALTTDERLARGGRA